MSTFLGKTDLIIAEKIKEALQNGFALHGRILHFIDSTYSNPSKAEIEKILAEDAGADKETLLRLIFSPDEPVRICVERLLESIDIGKDDIENIIGWLTGQEIESEIIFPDERGRIRAKAPCDILAEFVSHLNMQVKFHDRLIEAFGFIISDRSRIMAKVLIRNAGDEFAGTRLDFLADFFEKFGYEEESVFAGRLKTALEVLDDTNDQSDIYQALSRKKAGYFQSLINAERFEEMLRKGNIETLLLQGVRPVSVDRDKVKKEMEILDKICLAVYGKTEYCERNPSVFF